MSRAVHWNNNLCCAVDVETTGLDWEEDDIWQIAVVPLDSFYRRSKEHLPLSFFIRPRSPVRRKITGSTDNYRRACIMGMDYARSGDYFLDWFERLRLPPRKRILPLGHNYGFDRMFIREWLGPANYQHCFDHEERDTLRAVTLINDRADLRNEPIPFPVKKLGNCCSRLGIPLENPHDALCDSLATAELYRRLVAW